MNFELGVLFGAGVGYLLLLFIIAWLVDHGIIPDSLARHPLTYTLSLGVYATSWTYYGSVGFAQSHGYSFLAIYLGATLAFILTPVLLMPIMRLTREYQLTSLADLFAFRYRSQMAGILVTLFMLVGTLPYVALQIRAVTETARVLTHEATPQVLALGFCLMLIAFAMLFGARHASPREKHSGLVTAIAFESLVKLLALVTVALFAVFGVFGGPERLNQWLADNPEAVLRLYEPVQDNPWSTFLLLSFAASFLLPRQFHMAFGENLDARTLTHAAWGFPLLLLIMNLSIPVILWAGLYLTPDAPADYYALGITVVGSTSQWLPVFTFIGGLSAASAMVIVSTLALSSMCLNHIILPARYPDPDANLYRWLLWARRVLIALIILAGYGFYAMLEHDRGLVELGLISFVAVVQFVPGIVGTLYWRRATRAGFLAGLLAGGAVWFVVLLLPTLEQSEHFHSDLGVYVIEQSRDANRWAFSTFWTLTANVIFFVIGSLISRQSEEEYVAALACCSEATPPPRGVVAASSPDDFTRNLARQLGHPTAEREVNQALTDLRMDPAESEPRELLRLRERIERNLSGLLGPQLAHIIVDQRLVFDPVARTAMAESMRYLEERLEASRDRLRGMDAELDALRRFHRQILLDLPLGVCAVSSTGEVVIWNLAMDKLSSVSAGQAVGRPLHELPHPWDEILDEVAWGDERHLYRREIRVQDETRWLDLHKASVDLSISPDLIPGAPDVATVMIVEDLTEIETLEAELAHTERLASVGRLAAGVAHEIGNPVTGIASVAQNLRHEADTDQVRESVDMILDQAARITDIVRSLMTFSHSGSQRTGDTAIDVNALIDEASRLVRLDRAAKQVECDKICGADLRIEGDRPRLLQVLVNVLNNACDASAPGGRVEVIAIAEGDAVRLEIMDQGEGIAAADRERIFEPFFTTKDPGEGTGLGLSLVHKIVRDHGGHIDIDSEPGVGTRVSISLPSPPHDNPELPTPHIDIKAGHA
ncbi:MAG: ATP-binding protein [Gammaproteobacteria bacterium]